MIIQSLKSANLSSQIDHGDPNLHCTNATFSDIAIFYLANYFAHCATVKMMPGETATSSFASAAMALFFPTFGIVRAVSAIIRHARFTTKDEVSIAARAGAICMLVRSRHWTPRDGDVIRQCRTTSSQKSVTSWTYEFSPRQPRDLELQDVSGVLDRLPKGLLPMSVWDPRWMAELLPVVGSQRIYPSRRKVHGQLIIPEGYRLVPVPSDAEVVPLARKPGTPVSASHLYGSLVGISSNYNLPKAVVAIVQTVYAAITLYRSRGNQMEIFGYAAFGLTVAPYVVMSVVNLLAQIATPDYDALFLVKSDIMTEAEARGGVFDGAIGELVHEPISEHDPRSFNALVSKPEASDRFQLKLFRGCFSPEPETTSISDTRRENPPAPATHTFFPFRDGSGKYSEWLYIPSCTPFRRRLAVTDGTVHAPKDSRKYRSRNLEDDKADKGYLQGESIPERRYRVFFRVLIPLGISLVSLLVNGLLSGFRQGQSKRSQRSWIMTWLVTGIALAPLGNGMGVIFTDLWLDEWSKETKGKGSVTAIFGAMFAIFFSTLGGLLVVGISFVPAVGGLVVVGQMIKQYGHCVRMD